MSFELLALCPPLSKCWDYRQVHTTTQRLYVCMCVCCAVCVWHIHVLYVCMCLWVFCVCVGTNAKARGGHRVSSFFTFCLIPLRKVISLNLEHMVFCYAGIQDHPVIISASMVLVLEVSVRLCMAWWVGAGFWILDPYTFYLSPLLHLYFKIVFL